MWWEGGRGSADSAAVDSVHAVDSAVAVNL